MVVVTVTHRSMFLHPRRVACWLDEDYMKHVKTLALFSCRGRSRHTVAHGFMDRYRHCWSTDMDNC